MIKVSMFMIKVSMFMIKVSMCIIKIYKREENVTISCSAQTKEFQKVW